MSFQVQYGRADFALDLSFNLRSPEQSAQTGLISTSIYNYERQHVFLTQRPKILPPR